MGTKGDLVALVHEEAGARNMSEDRTKRIGLKNADFSQLFAQASLGCWVVELALQPPAEAWNGRRASKSIFSHGKSLALRCEDREDASALAWSISEHPSPLRLSLVMQSCPSCLWVSCVEGQLSKLSSTGVLHLKGKCKSIYMSI